jgi:glycine betaine/choline ABC-type transport system substrate-binding protein
LLLGFGLLASRPSAAGPGRTAEVLPAAAAKAGTVRVGSKNFTEQLILGEIMAQLIERQTDLNVIRKFDLGGTMICHGALVSGGIDLYPEYTGTALTAVLEADMIPDPEGAYAFVARAYHRRFNLRWLQPFGFNNTYAITVRNRDAEAMGLRTISDLAPLAARLRAGWTFEFSERPDGYPGLRGCYGFEFGRVIDLESSFMYEALARDEVDVISAFATDGRIAEYGLVPLEDDLGFFPPYLAAPVIRAAVVDQHPELASTLNQLAGRLSTERMQTLNLEVDQHKRSPHDVASQFLDRLQRAGTGSE